MPRHPAPHRLPAYTIKLMHIDHPLGAAAALAQRHLGHIKLLKTFRFSHIAPLLSAQFLCQPTPNRHFRKCLPKDTPVPLLPSLPDRADVPALMAFANQVLRGDGVLSRAGRELIAACVCGLNTCQFCHGSHRLCAQVLGNDGAVPLDSPDDRPSQRCKHRLPGNGR